ncbi:MAG: methyltransferase domain-containing protein [Oscillospiraceae bacterium]|nr:methyltransferase domain-containing protein [Oscillospiraceae bacterium]
MNITCPVCGGIFLREEKRFLCSKGHSFDCARSGYVNLLQRQKHRQRGDDAVMAAARRDFLNRGYYQQLLDRIVESVLQYRVSAIADIGCGEGWYSCGVLSALQKNGIQASLCGIDISPEILRFAANRAKECGMGSQTAWAVASVNRIPLEDQSCDCILNLFAPCEEKEFARILSDRGVLIRAIPLEKHLWELKTAVYERPYENRPVVEASGGFQMVDMKRIDYQITVPREDLQTLFAMTPYSHKTSREDAEKLLSFNQLTTSVSFGLLICQKK